MPTIETSIILGRVWGMVTMVIAAAFLFNWRRFPAVLTEFTNTGILVLSGIVTLLAGVTTVVLHNLWVSDWRVLVTLFGWIAILKGVLRLFFPEQLSRWLQSFGPKPLPWLIPALIFSFILGLYLIVVTGVVPAAV